MPLDFKGKNARLTGADDLHKVLKQLPRQLGEKALVSAVRSGAQVVRKAAKERAPVGTGKLTANIITRRDRTQGKSVTMKIGPSKKVFYGMFLEFGTRFSPARPWLRPAFDEVSVEALKRMADRLGSAVETAAEKLAGRYSTSGLKRKRRKRRRR